MDKGMQNKIASEVDLESLTQNFVTLDTTLLSVEN
jgi:hypothetical protein